VIKLTAAGQERMTVRGQIPTTANSRAMYLCRAPLHGLPWSPTAMALDRRESRAWLDAPGNAVFSRCGLRARLVRGNSVTPGGPESCADQR
jgi:hypothetical protein